MYNEQRSDGKRRCTIAETVHVSRKTIYRHLEPAATKHRPRLNDPRRDQLVHFLSRSLTLDALLTRAALSEEHDSTRYCRYLEVSAVV
jgi:hypothetical protein